MRIPLLVILVSLNLNVIVAQSNVETFERIPLSDSSFWRLPELDDRLYHLGFEIGTNYLTPKLINASHGAYFNPKNGLNFNVLGALHLTPYAELRISPGVSFFEHELFLNVSPQNGLPSYEMLLPIECSNFYIPLEIKFRQKRKSNFNPFICTGIAYNINVVESHPNIINPKYLVSQSGIGMDWYLEYYRLGINLKYLHGLSPYSNNNNLPLPYDLVKLRGWMLSFTFEG